MLFKCLIGVPIAIGMVNCLVMDFRLRTTDYSQFLAAFLLLIIHCKLFTFKIDSTSFTFFNFQFSISTCPLSTSSQS